MVMVYCFHHFNILCLDSKDCFELFLYISHRYTGCFQKWLNAPDNEVYLKTGVAANCPSN